MRFISIAFFVALVGPTALSSQAFAKTWSTSLKSCKDPSSDKCTESLWKYLVNKSMDEYRQITLPACRSGNRWACRAFYLNGPSAEERFWGSASENPLSYAFSPPREVLEQNEVTNRSDGIKRAPSKPQIDAALGSALLRVWDRILPAVSSLVQSRVRGIFFVHNVGSSAFSYEVRNDQDQPVGYVIVLDEQVMKRKANNWATWKERLVLEESSSVQVSIEEEKNDSYENTLEFILLHELGHLVSFLDGYLPSSLDRAMKDTLGNFPYFSMGWTSAKNGYSSIYDQMFTERKEIRFYDPTRKRQPVESLYRHLALTGFPTLQSVSSPNEDFADSFASYVHVVLLHKPYKVTLPGSATPLLQSCWDEERCKKRRAFFDKLFKNEDSPRK